MHDPVAADLGGEGTDTLGHVDHPASCGPHLELLGPHG
jgi:hypothetical protein